MRCEHSDTLIDIHNCSHILGVQCGNKSIVCFVCCDVCICMCMCACACVLLFASLYLLHDKNYRIAGKIGGTKFWRMNKEGCFGEYNFGVSALAAHVLRPAFILERVLSPNSPIVTPSNIFRYTVYS